jgi:hypothetical protein
LESAVIIGAINGITPETFKEAANYMQNGTLTLKGAKKYSFIKEKCKEIFEEVVLTIKN